MDVPPAHPAGIARRNNDASLMSSSTRVRYGSEITVLSFSSCVCVCTRSLDAVGGLDNPYFGMMMMHNHLNTKYGRLFL